jgi:hypothetical protein
MTDDDDLSTISAAAQAMLDAPFSRQDVEGGVGDWRLQTKLRHRLKLPMFADWSPGGRRTGSKSTMMITILKDDAPNEAPITELFAFVSMDDKGNEGICAGIAVGFGSANGERITPWHQENE